METRDGQRMLMTTDPFGETNGGGASASQFDVLPGFIQFFYVLRNCLFWCLIILFYVSAAIVSTTVFAPMSCLVHIIAELGFWSIYAVKGHTEVFNLDDTAVMMMWGIIGSTSLSSFMYYFYGTCISQIIECILLMQAQMQFMKLLIFTKFVGIDCIEKTPEIYNMYQTAEGWFDEMATCLEFHVIMFTLRVFGVDTIMRMKFGTTLTVSRELWNSEAWLNQSMQCLCVSFVLLWITTELLGKPNSLYETETLIWNFPHSLVGSAREFYSRGNKLCYNTLSTEDPPECVICLETLCQKVSWVRPEERSNLSVSRLRPKFGLSSLRKRKVEHSGEVVDRYESGLLGERSMWKEVCEPVSGTLEATTTYGTSTSSTFGLNRGSNSRISPSRYSAFTSPPPDYDLTDGGESDSAGGNGGDPLQKFLREDEPDVSKYSKYLPWNYNFGMRNDMMESGFTVGGLGGGTTSQPPGSRRTSSGSPNPGNSNFASSPGFPASGNSRSPQAHQQSSYPRSLIGMVVYTIGLVVRVILRCITSPVRRLFGLNGSSNPECPNGGSGRNSNNRSNTSGLGTRLRSAANFDLRRLNLDGITPFRPPARNDSTHGPIIGQFILGDSANFDSSDSDNDLIDSRSSARSSPPGSPRHMVGSPREYTRHVDSIFFSGNNSSLPSNLLGANNPFNFSGANDNPFSLNDNNSWSNDMVFTSNNITDTMALTMSTGSTSGGARGSSTSSASNVRNMMQGGSSSSSSSPGGNVGGNPSSYSSGRGNGSGGDDGSGTLFSLPGISIEHFPAESLSRRKRSKWNQPDKRNVRLMCGHQFHKPCLANWIACQKDEALANSLASIFGNAGSTVATCPTCRKVLSWSPYSTEAIGKVVCAGHCGLLICILTFPLNWLVWYLFGVAWIICGYIFERLGGYIFGSELANVASDVSYQLGSRFQSGYLSFRDFSSLLRRLEEAVAAHQSSGQHAQSSVTSATGNASSSGTAAVATAAAKSSVSSSKSNAVGNHVLSSTGNSQEARKPGENTAVQAGKPGENTAVPPAGPFNRDEDDKHYMVVKEGQKEGHFDVMASSDSISRNAEPMSAVLLGTLQDTTVPSSLEEFAENVKVLASKVGQMVGSRSMFMGVGLFGQSLVTYLDYATYADVARVVGSKLSQKTQIHPSSGRGTSKETPPPTPVDVLTYLKQASGGAQEGQSNSVLEMKMHTVDGANSVSAQQNAANVAGDIVSAVRESSSGKLTIAVSYDNNVKSGTLGNDRSFSHDILRSLQNMGKYDVVSASSSSTANICSVPFSSSSRSSSSRIFSLTDSGLRYLDRVSYKIREEHGTGPYFVWRNDSKSLRKFDLPSLCCDIVAEIRNVAMLKQRPIGGYLGSNSKYEAQNTVATAKKNNPNSEYFSSDEPSLLDDIATLGKATGSSGIAKVINGALPAKGEGRGLGQGTTTESEPVSDIESKEALEFSPEERSALILETIERYLGELRELPTEEHHSYLSSQFRLLRSMAQEVTDISPENGVQSSMAKLIENLILDRVIMPEPL